jgi:hypothetical protein
MASKLAGETSCGERSRLLRSVVPGTLAFNRLGFSARFLPGGLTAVTAVA